MTPNKGGKGIYRSVVTLTTVGDGDIAVPTGIVTVEIAQAARTPVSTQSCPDCSSPGHDAVAVHCKYCGAEL